jgi:nicotinate dehydrogenase subunit B
MGAQVDGWWAPALAAAGTLGPAWSEQDFYDYLRHGQSPRHGVAGGPMAPVIAELAELPDEDVRAMAHYLSSLGHETAASPQSNAEGNAQAVRLERLAQTQAASLAPSRGARAFEAACAVCHVEGPFPRSACALRSPSTAPCARPFPTT